MRERELEFVSEADGRIIFMRCWLPEAAPKAVVLIVHGLAEHSARYRRLAAALVGAGYAAYASDHRGHGRSMRPGDAPGDFGAGGWGALVADLGQARRLASAEQGGAPVALIGHSMGSFASQTLLLDESREFAACVLSGSSDLPTVAAFAASGADLSFASFNAAFEPAQTPFDWLSRDAAEVDRYIADPLCGFDAPPETGLAIISAAARLGSPEEMRRVRSDLPILIISGDQDPVGGAGALLPMLRERYRAAGVDDVTLKLYPGARHELFNETNRDEVTRDVIHWLQEQLG
jgi:alpha-beta hydrolase superfamily lysophospholipase